MLAVPIQWLLRNQEKINSIDMKRIKTFLATTVAALAVIAIAACSGKGDAGKKEAATKENKVQTVDVNRVGKTNMVYVNIDTLCAKYQLVIDYSERLGVRSENAAKELETKAKSFDEDFKRYERRVKNNELSVNQMKSEEERLGKLQRELAELEYRYNNEIAEATFNAKREINDSIMKCLNEYNAVHKYDFIFTKTDNQDLFQTSYAGLLQHLFPVLPVANPEFDITNDILKILNDNYKSIK